jgi:methionine synthase II (cobalamin-independent)
MNKELQFEEKKLDKEETYRFINNAFRMVISLQQATVLTLVPEK